MSRSWESTTAALPSGREESRSAPPQACFARTFVLFLGALSTRKNVGRLLEAWSHCKQSDVQLLIAGGGGSSHVLAGTELPPLPPNTRTLGKIDEADVPGLLTAAEAFAYPSLYEGFGLPPLEAMACGTPCLVSNVTALPEVAADAAVQVNPLDSGDIAQGLNRILGDGVLRDELRKKGLSVPRASPGKIPRLRRTECCRATKMADEGGTRRWIANAPRAPCPRSSP